MEKPFGAGGLAPLAPLQRMRGLSGQIEDHPQSLLLAGVADGGAPQGHSACAALSPCPPQQEVLSLP